MPLEVNDTAMHNLVELMESHGRLVAGQWIIEPRANDRRVTVNRCGLSRGDRTRMCGPSLWKRVDRVPFWRDVKTEKNAIGAGCAPSDFQTSTNSGTFGTRSFRPSRSCSTTASDSPDSFMICPGDFPAATYVSPQFITCGGATASNGPFTLVLRPGDNCCIRNYHLDGVLVDRVNEISGDAAFIIPHSILA